MLVECEVVIRPVNFDRHARATVSVECVWSDEGGNEEGGRVNLIVPVVVPAPALSGRGLLETYSLCRRVIDSILVVTDGFSILHGQN